MKLPIPDDWDGSSWCKWAICWPESEKWEGILRGFITLPHRGRTWDERTGLISDVQSTGREITAANLPLIGVLMACNDTEITAAFSDIALAIRALADAQCCDNLQIDVNGGVQGSVVSPLGQTIPIFGSQPPLSPGPGEFPVEFPDLETYNLSKCQVANGISDGLIGALKAFTGISIAQFTLGIVLTVLAFAGAIVFPPAGFPALMVALGILGGSTGLLLAMAIKLEENRDELVCILYSGDSTSSVIGALADFFDTLIALIPGVGVLGMTIKTILLVLVNSDTVNQLFNSSAAYVFPDANCTACEVCVSVNFGIGTASNTEPYTLESVEEAGIHYIEVISDTDLEFEVISTDGYTVGAQATGIQNSAGNWLWRWNVDGDPPPFQTWTARLVGYGSLTPFTITMSHTC